MMCVWGGGGGEGRGGRLPTWLVDAVLRGVSVVPKVCIGGGGGGAAVLFAVLHPIIPPAVHRRPSAPSSSCRTRAPTCPHSCRASSTHRASCRWAQRWREGEELQSIPQSKYRKRSSFLPPTRMSCPFPLPSLAPSLVLPFVKIPLPQQVHKVASYRAPTCIVLPPFPPAGAQGRLVLRRQAQ